MKSGHLVRDPSPFLNAAKQGLEAKAKFATKPALSLLCEVLSYADSHDVDSAANALLASCLELVKDPPVLLKAFGRLRVLNLFAQLVLPLAKDLTSTPIPTDPDLEQFVRPLGAMCPA